MAEVDLLDALLGASAEPRDIGATGLELGEGVERSVVSKVVIGAELLLGVDPVVQSNGELVGTIAADPYDGPAYHYHGLWQVDSPARFVRADNWHAAIDATDQLVITMSARNDSAETAARLLDHLEQTGRRELVRRAVTVVTMPPHRKEVDPRTIERHFDQRCRIVLRVPYDRHLDSGAPVRYAALSPESRRAWLRVAAAVADGL